MGNTNGEKVAAIRHAWRQLMPEEPPSIYGSGPAVDLDLYAQVAINVLTDWHKSEPKGQGYTSGHPWQYDPT